MAVIKLSYREKLLQQHAKDVERYKRKLAKKEHKARMLRVRARMVDVISRQTLGRLSVSQETTERGG